MSEHVANLGITARQRLSNLVLYSEEPKGGNKEEGSLTVISAVSDC